MEIWSKGTFVLKKRSFGYSLSAGDPKMFFLLLFYFLSTFNGKINAKMRIVAKMRMKIKKSCQCSITDSENSDDHCMISGGYPSSRMSPPLRKQGNLGEGAWSLNHRCSFEYRYDMQMTREGDYIRCSADPRTTFPGHVGN